MVDVVAISLLYDRDLPGGFVFIHGGSRVGSKEQTVYRLALCRHSLGFIMVATWYQHRDEEMEVAVFLPKSGVGGSEL